MSLLRYRGLGVAAMVLSCGLAACQGDSETVTLTPEEAAHLKLKRYEAGHGRAVGQIVSEFGSEEGSGEVVAVDPVGLTVSIRHRQASGDDWPGMVMNFRIRKTLVAALKPGQRVYFRAVVLDGAGELLDVRPAT